MAEIRIDQSHCNFWLAKALESDGWNILFKDSGRVSRGGGGTQGLCLRVFEENGLPIPDLVAVLGHQVLLVEIDSAFSKSAASLLEYRLYEPVISGGLRSVSPSASNAKCLKLGFCKMEKCRLGQEKILVNIVKAAGMDLAITFPSAGAPFFNWIVSD